MLVVLLAVLVLISGVSVLLAYNHLIDIPIINNLFNKNENSNSDNSSYFHYDGDFSGKKIENAEKAPETLKELSEKTLNKNIATAQEIQEYLTKVMRGQEQEECVTVEGTGDGYSEARIIKKQVTPKDRTKAAETLAKMTGCFDIKLKIENVPIIEDNI